jgi:diaphanous 1
MAPGAPSFSSAPAVPKKKNPKPSVPMRVFHWSVVPAQDTEGTIWKQIDDEKVNFDKKSFEEVFSTASTKKPGAAPAASDPAAMMAAAMGGRAPAAKKEVIELIDPKRSYAINIALARFRMSHAAIRDALFSMDEKSLDEEKLSSLEKVTPTGEELEAVRDYEGDEKELGNTEQFFRTILPVPHVAQRVQCFLFKFRFSVQAAEIEQQLAVCEQQVKTIRNSKNLHGILELTLALGNYLNGGTAKGGAFGFKLETLTKLKGTKSADNSVTLLQFLIQQVKAKTPKLASFTEELKQIGEASRVEYSNLQTEINKIKGSVAKVKTELDTCPRTAKDRFHSVMQDFYDSASKKSSSISQRLTALDSAVADTVKFYADDPSSLKMEDLFRTFNTFLQDWKEGEDALEQKRVQKEKAEKQAAEAEKRKRENEEKKIGKNLAAAPAATGGVDKDKVVDSVMQTLNATDSNALMAAIKARRAQNAESDAVKKASFSTLKGAAGNILQAGKVANGLSAGLLKGGAKK